MTIIEVETFHEAWDCTQCETKGLSAFNCKQCPTCGAPLDIEKVYQTDRPVENYQFKGHDINCAHCLTRNEKRFSCRNCGASLKDGDDKMVAAFNYTEAKVTPKPVGNRVPEAATRFYEELPRPTPRPAPSRVNLVSSGKVEDSDAKWKYITASVVIVFLLLAFWLYKQLNAVVPATLTVDQVNWSFKLPLEDYKPRSDNLVTQSSRSAVPSDAYGVSSRRVHIRSEPIYENKHISKTCTKTDSRSNSDGTWSRITSSYDCSTTIREQTGTKEIWGNRFEFKVDRWQAINPITREGFGHQTNFPTFTADPKCLSDKPYHGCIRASSGPITVYTVYMSYMDNNERKEMTQTLPRSTWETMVPGMKTEVILNNFGQIRSIKGIDSDYQKLLSE